MTKAADQTVHPDRRLSVYEPLHNIARKASRRVSPEHSLQPTLLNSRVFMRLLNQRDKSLGNRTVVTAADA